ncbi:hypothetical protein LZ198_02390 [Myxococcus sp. K15C18031901]|uniref:hypothetical protein n=1 Tax=Myxococcus dinghuensis TaxID=2906761 RepID=UPI0020A7CFED|nr:hypothetical protein [Myxococcus dinghuensis]MCP3097721.1 hypothetical protein [Myxococcus dinghuensis]
MPPVRGPSRPRSNSLQSNSSANPTAAPARPTGTPRTPKAPESSGLHSHQKQDTTGGSKYTMDLMEQPQRKHPAVNLTPQQAAAQAPPPPPPPPGPPPTLQTSNAVAQARPQPYVSPFNGNNLQGSSGYVRQSNIAREPALPQSIAVDPHSQELFRNGSKGNVFSGVMNLNSGQIHLTPLVPRDGGPNGPHFPLDKLAQAKTGTEAGGAKPAIPLLHTNFTQRFANLQAQQTAQAPAGQGQTPAWLAEKKRRTDISSHQQLVERVGGNESDYVGFSVHRGEKGDISRMSFTSRSLNNPHFETRPTATSHGIPTTSADGRLSERFASEVLKGLKRDLEP